jgi:hypothetical protein
MRSTAATAFARLETADKDDALPAVLGLGIADFDAIAKDSRVDQAMIAAHARDQMAHWSLAEGLAEGTQDNLAYFMLVFSTHYVAAAISLVRRKDEYLKKAMPHPILFEAFEKRLARTANDGPDSFSIDLAQQMAAQVAHSTLLTWLAIAVLRHEGGPEPDEDYAPVRQAAVSHLSLLYELRHILLDFPLYAELVGEVVTPTAAAVGSALGTRQQLSQTLSSIGYHALNTMDFDALARRDPQMRARFGMSIEHAFERQTALLFASFGYAVVESRPGKRHVDLLCVAATPESASFVVEAKTTEKKYTFPAPHERALIDHVAEVKRTLWGLPTLKLILVVAPEFTAGAETRLEAVGRRHGMPCIGISAAALAMIRVAIIGDVPFDVFYDELTTGARVAGAKEATHIIAVMTARNESWKQFADINRRARAHQRPDATSH